MAVLAFYTRQRVPVLASAGETRMTFHQADRQALILEPPALSGLVGQGREVFVVGEPEQLQDRLDGLGLAVQLLDDAGGRVLYRLSP